MGDKSKKLNFDERLQLMYAKGSRYYEDEPVFRSGLDDIDMDFVAEYCKKIGYSKSAEEYIRQNKDYIVRHDGREEMSGAALLLFGKEPQRFFPRARVRFIRYDGTEAKVGTEMNVIKDKMFEGKILDVVRQSLEFVGDQIKERTRLGNDGRFLQTATFCGQQGRISRTVRAILSGQPGISAGQRVLRPTDQYYSLFQKKAMLSQSVQ